MNADTKIHDAVERSVEGGSRKYLEVDVDRYQAFLDDPALTPDQREEIIRALWSIIMAFVELGFGVHPVQQACGKPGTELEQTGKSESTEVDLEQHRQPDEDTPAP